MVPFLGPLPGYVCVKSFIQSYIFFSNFTSLVIYIFKFYQMLPRPTSWPLPASGPVPQGRSAPQPPYPPACLHHHSPSYLPLARSLPVLQAWNLLMFPGSHTTAVVIVWNKKLKGLCLCLKPSICLEKVHFRIQNSICLPPASFPTPSSLSQLTSLVVSHVIHSIMGRLSWPEANIASPSLSSLITSFPHFSNYGCVFFNIKKEPYVSQIPFPGLR